MLKSVSIENYRNLESLRLDNLGRINLIAGKNGAGKTALLEALWLLSEPDNPELAVRVDAFRGHYPLIGPENLFHSIFRDFNPTNTIQVQAYVDGGDSPRSLTISLQERKQVTTTRYQSLRGVNPERHMRSQDESDYEIVFDYKRDGEAFVSRAWGVAQPSAPESLTPFQTYFGMGLQQERQRVPGRPGSAYIAAAFREDIQTLATAYGRLELEGKSGLVQEFIHILEPRLQRILTIAIEDVPVMHAELDGMKNPVPLQLLGEALNRMFQLALALSASSDGLVLVDEIENGLHHSVQEQVFANLHELAESFDVQVFATTQSNESIWAAYWALRNAESLDHLTFHRLDRVNGHVEAVQFDSEMLDTAYRHNLEIR